MEEDSDLAAHLRDEIRKFNEVLTNNIARINVYHSKGLLCDTERDREVDAWSKWFDERVRVLVDQLRILEM